MIKKLPSSISVLFFFALVASAQDKIEGQIVEKTTGDPLGGIIVSVFSIKDNHILGYAPSDSNGYFSIDTKNALPDSIRLDIRGFTIKNLSIECPALHERMIIEVETKVLEIKEARISAPKIEQKGDTVKYNVSSYSQLTDKNIGEVLKRLPGIEVSSSGQIAYQGKEISKFYIEGMDLLQGKYGLATKNLDAAKVSEVQILENHQPIKVLKGAVTPEAAAINLKLKKSAIGAFFLTGQLGIGLAYPLFSNELLGMRFTRRQQNLLLFKQDNTGRDITEEMISFYNTPSSSSPSFFSMQANSAPSIGRQRSLFNNSYLASINNLHSFSKGSIITTNINYLQDRNTSTSSFHRDVFLGEGLQSLHFDESDNTVNKSKEVNGIVNYENNTNNRYVSNRIQFYSKVIDCEKASSSLGKEYLQNLNVSELSVEDNLRSIWKIGSKRFDLTGNASFLSQDNDFSLPNSMPSLGFYGNALEQTLGYRLFKSNINVSRSFKLNDRLEFSYTVGSFIDYKSISSFISSNLNKFEIDSLSNDIARKETGINGACALSYLGRKFRFIFNLPVHFTFVGVDTPLSHNKDFHPIPRPNISVTQTINPRLTVNLNANYSETHGSVSDALDGYIIGSYREFIRYHKYSGKTNRLYSYINLAYKDPFSSFFGSLSYYGTILHRDVINSVYYDGLLAKIKTIPHSNTNFEYTTNGKIGFCLESIGADVSMVLQYNRRIGDVINQGILSKYCISRCSFSPKVNGSIGKRIIYDYNLSISKVHNMVGDNQTSTLHTLSQNGKVSLLASKRCYFTATLSHYANYHRLWGNTSSLFGDIAFQYKTNNVEYLLDLTNLFASNTYSLHSETGAESCESIYTIRPVELLFRVRFNLK